MNFILDIYKCIFIEKKTSKAQLVFQMNYNWLKTGLFYFYSPNIFLKFLTCSNSFSTRLVLVLLVQWVVKLLVILQHLAHFQWSPVKCNFNSSLPYLRLRAFINNSSRGRNSNTFFRCSTLDATGRREVGPASRFKCDCIVNKYCYFFPFMNEVCLPRAIIGRYIWSFGPATLCRLALLLCMVNKYIHQDKMIVGLSHSLDRATP